MLSTHWPKGNTVPREYLCLGAGLVIIMSMLIGIATVAGDQVKKAKMRDSLLTSQRTATIYCVETLRGEALNRCIQQAKADPYGTDKPTAVADSGIAFSSRALVVPSGNQGFMTVGFSARR